MYVRTYILAWYPGLLILALVACSTNAWEGSALTIGRKEICTHLATSCGFFGNVPLLHTSRYITAHDLVLPGLPPR